MNLHKYAVVIDFDGTITCNDMGLAVITEFGAPGWEEGGIHVGGRAYPARPAWPFDRARERQASPLRDWRGR